MMHPSHGFQNPSAVHPSELARSACPQNGTAQSYDYNTLYNLTDNTFEPVYIHELAFCGGNTLLPDGRAFIVGGQCPVALHPLGPFM